MTVGYGDITPRSLFLLNIFKRFYRKNSLYFVYDFLKHLTILLSFNSWLDLIRYEQRRRWKIEENEDNQ
jgi:hypothetical protein